MRTAGCLRNLGDLVTNYRTGRWLGILAFCASLGAQPVLEQIEPRGAKVGSATQLVLTGKRLGPSPRLMADAGFSATPLVDSSEGGQNPASRLVFLIEVDASATPGIYPLRVETAEGLSNSLLFTISGFPHVSELESDPRTEEDEVANDFPETAQPLEVPVMVGGRLQGAERDLYRVRLERGQAMVAEVTARRAGSAIDPNLELLDGNGQVVARNGDAPGLGLDSRLAFKAPESGDYFVAVRDERFSSQDQNFYLLTVGAFEFAESVYPLGWTRGARVQAEFFGGNLGSPIRAEVETGEPSGHAQETWISVPGTPSSIPFLLSDSPEALESQVRGVIEEGVVVNGRIAKAGEVDTYRLPVQPGEQWAFELRSGELPGSSLYGVMTIRSGDETLAVAGKYAGDPNPYIITTTGETATYPFVNLTVPPETSEIEISVEDLLERGGRQYSYRLSARKQGPDFLLTLNEPYLNIPRNGSVTVSVTAERRGYFGPIQLYLENGPEDLDVTGGHISPTSTLGNTLPRFETGRLTLTASAEAKLRVLDLVVRGRATESGQEHLDRRAIGAGVRVPVKGDNQPAVTANWLGYDLPARINPEQPAYVQFDTPRVLRLVRGGTGVVAKWSYGTRSSEVRLKQEIDIPRNSGSLRLRRVGEWDGKDSAEFRMFTHERTSLGMVNFNMTATVVASGREHTVISQPLEVDVVDGYTLEAPTKDLELDAGGQARWQGAIWRDPEFRRAVTVSAIGLPSDVSCEAVVLSDDQTGYELACSAGAKAPTGSHEVEIRAESVLSDEGTTPYIAEPAAARVVIRR